MKGILPLIGGVLIVLFIGVVSIFIIGYFFKYHLWYTIEYTYTSSREDLVLLSFLNSECDGKQVYKIISMSDLIPIDSSKLSCMQNKLDMLAASDCYRLFIEESDGSEKNLISKGMCSLNREVCYRLALPYGDELVKNICLSIGD